MNGRDPLRELQAAARVVAEHVAPGHAARRVVVFDEDGRKLIDATVPAGCPGPALAPAPPPPTPGWAVTDKQVFFDGDALPMGGRRLDVLRVLIESDVATVDDLRAAWGDYKAEESTIRWQVGELKKALKKCFGDFPGELIESTGAGYKLILR